MYDRNGRAARLALGVLGLSVLAVPVALAATIEGTPGNDRLSGTPGADRIYGYAGRDVIRPRGGDDHVYGGPGDDDVYMDGLWPTDRSGADRGYGGPGDDYMSVGTGDLAGMGSGDDWGSVTFRGGVVYGGAGRDHIDVVAVGEFHFGSGPDLACGWAQDSFEPPRDATFRFWLGPGNDRAFGPAGDRAAGACYEAWDVETDIVWAGSGDDRLRFVESGRDRVYAGPGDDSIWVRNKNHRVVDCGPGHDVLTLIEGARPRVIRDCERIERIQRP